MADLEKSKSFRTTEERYERLEQLDEFSDIFRTMAELYLDETFFRNGVDAYRNDKVEAYSEAYFETTAEEMSSDVVQELDSRVEPEEVVRPLRDYLAAVNFGDRLWAEDAAEDFYDVSEELGDFFTAYTQRFSEGQWDRTLE
jgi:hypothetical protein